MDDSILFLSQLHVTCTCIWIMLATVLLHITCIPGYPLNTGACTELLTDYAFRETFEGEDIWHGSSPIFKFWSLLITRTNDYDVQMTGLLMVMRLAHPREIPIVMPCAIMVLISNYLYKSCSRVSFELLYILTLYIYNITLHVRVQWTAGP
jgi:hypothetical protein